MVEVEAPPHEKRRTMEGGGMSRGSCDEADSAEERLSTSTLLASGGELAARCPEICERRPIGPLRSVYALTPPAVIIVGSTYAWILGTRCPPTKVSIKHIVMMEGYCYCCYTTPSH